jgi:hypothetical protein
MHLVLQEVDFQWETRSSQKTQLSKTTPFQSGGRKGLVEVLKKLFGKMFNMGTR